MSSVQAAIDGITTALQAVDWTASVGVSVTVDKTPGRVWKLAERRAGPIVYVFGGGSGFEMNGRNLVLLEQPTVLLATLRHIGFDAHGQVLSTGLVTAEAVATTALQTARTWLVASTRFAPLRFERPERYDPDQMLKGDYLSTLIITVLDGQRL